MFALLIVLIHALAVRCISASFHPASPPEQIVYSFPTTDVAIHSEVTLGLSGGPYRVPHDYYGLGYLVNVSTTMPNGTNVVWKTASNLGQHCSGKANVLRSGQLNTVTFVPIFTGKYVDFSLYSNVTEGTDLCACRHTAFWNITYGTRSDPKIANQTGCDVSRLSYQTWSYNASFNVVDATPTDHPSPVYATLGVGLAPTPTGTIFESNSAGSSAPRIAYPILCALLGAVVAA